MKREVEVMEIARDARPDERPLVIDRFEVSANTVDGARKAALSRLASDGRTVRSLSFLEGGGLVAVVSPALPAQATKRAAGRALRGGK